MKTSLLFVGVLLLVAVPFLMVRLDLLAAEALRLIPSIVGIYVALYFAALALLRWRMKKIPKDLE